jgi:hypothetical protein
MVNSFEIFQKRIVSCLPKAKPRSSQPIIAVDQIGSQGLSAQTSA